MKETLQNPHYVELPNGCDFNTEFKTYIIAFCPDTDSWFVTNKRFFYYEYNKEFETEEDGINFFKDNPQIFYNEEIRMGVDRPSFRKNGVWLDNINDLVENITEEVEDTEEIEIDFEDLLILSTGLDENGIPNTTAVLTIEELVDEKILKRRKEVVIDEGSFAYAIEGGCAVVEIILNKQNTNQYKRTCDICNAWLTNKDSEEYKNRIITLTIMPRVMEGQLVISLEGLVHYLGIAEENESRVILCFDNNRTRIFETGVDYNEIKNQVELETLNEERELDSKIFETEEEIKKLEEEIYYEENIANVMDVDLEENTNNINKNLNPNRKYGMRISKSEEEEE